MVNVVFECPLSELTVLNFIKEWRKSSKKIKSKNLKNTLWLEHLCLQRHLWVSADLVPLCTRGVRHTILKLILPPKFGRKF